MGIPYVIEIESAVATLHGATSLSLENDIGLATSYMTKDAEYVRKATGWDGVVRFFDKVHLTFPCGLTNVVKAVIETHHANRGESADVVVVDHRPDPRPFGIDVVPDFDDGIELRPYQWEALARCIVENSGMVQSPTGSGKTILIAKLVSTKKLPTVIYVHTKDLLYQMKEKLTLAIPGLVVGQIGDGVCDPQAVTVAMVQTVAVATESIKWPKRLDMDNIRDEKDLESKLRDYDAKNKEFFLERLDAILRCLQDAAMVIYDESHHVPARTFMRTAFLMRNARYRFGFSATQWRNDGAEIAICAALGPKVFIRDASDLTPEYLVPAEITFLDVPPMFFEEDDKYQTIYSLYVIENELRNGIIARKALDMVADGHHVIVLVNRINHGENIMSLIAPRCKAAFIRGELDSETRGEMLGMMKVGELDVLVGTSLADEGLDIPVADVLILAGGGCSKVKTLQRVGRVLRPYPGKKKAIVFDIADKCKYLREHCLDRDVLYRSERAWKVVYE